MRRPTNSDPSDQPRSHAHKRGALNGTRPKLARLQAAHSNEVKALALELLAETARKAGARVIEFKIRSEARSVRLEARWTESPSENAATEPNRSQPSAMIRRLADQSGITHCLWAELSIA
jgi:hypothetical protein